MNKRESGDDTAGPSKQPKTIDGKKSEIAFDQNPSPDIFKLHAIACFELFEYLTLSEIYSVGQTCKRFNHIAGNYFQDNFSAPTYKYEKNGQITLGFDNYMSMSGFSQYVKNIEIDTTHLRLSDFKYIGANCKSLKMIHFTGMTKPIAEEEIECIKDILTKIEHIEFTFSARHDLYGRILEYCSNIKCISIPPLMSKDTKWMHQKYPTLEHLIIKSDMPPEVRIAEYKVFFDQNPNIRNLDCPVKCLIGSEGWLLATNASFDSLSIFYDVGSYNTNSFCSLINKLYERGFYKKLTLELYCAAHDEIDEICKLPSVEILFYFHNMRGNINWPVITSAKIFCTNRMENIELINISKFPNVEQIGVMTLNFDQLLVCIGQLRKLKDLRFVLNGEKTQSLNLWALNKERKKLTGAGKVTFYVHENLFVATKWAYKSREFELIEIKRAESCYCSAHT